MGIKSSVKIVFGKIAVALSFCFQFGCFKHGSRFANDSFSASQRSIDFFSNENLDQILFK